MLAIGYVRVSTGEQADSGAGLAAQRSAIAAACAAKGWTLLRVEEDAGASGKAMSGRAAMDRALAAMKAGEAQVLVASELARFSRSVADFALLVDRAKRERWSVAALDMDIDMSTPTGQLMATIVSAMAQYERQLVGQRTRDSLAEKRAQGVRLGRPRALSDEVVGRIVAERQAGASTPAIARGLNADRVPTAHGGARWYPSTIQRVLASAREAATAA
jgi:DNA invertase Pin-like site-specific DNA recombinase